jgi:hypothetical protein
MQRLFTLVRPKKGQVMNKTCYAILTKNKKFCSLSVQINCIYFNCLA